MPIGEGINFCMIKKVSIVQYYNSWVSKVLFVRTSPYLEKCRELQRFRVLFHYLQHQAVHMLKLGGILQVVMAKGQKHAFQLSDILDEATTNLRLASCYPYILKTFVGSIFLKKLIFSILMKFVTNYGVKITCFHGEIQHCWENLELKFLHDQHWWY